MTSVLVFGESGQVARALSDNCPSDLSVYFAGRNSADLSVPGNAGALLEQVSPGWIINAAAYTAVDAAESEAGLAHRLNAEAVAEMASYADQHQIPMVHLSTDFVFDGEKREPYHPGDPTSPLGEYGRSKLAGELALLGLAPEQSMVIRTSWVYYEVGQNFVKTMLRLMEERDTLSVVDDQRGSPTYAGGLAEIIWQIVCGGRFVPGIYHWTDKGELSWYEFAVQISIEAAARGLLDKPTPVAAIPTEAYPTPAARPAYSVLNSEKLENLLGITTKPWSDQLKVMLDRLI